MKGEKQYSSEREALMNALPFRFEEGHSASTIAFKNFPLLFDYVISRQLVGDFKEWMEKRPKK